MALFLLHSPFTDLRATGDGGDENPCLPEGTGTDYEYWEDDPNADPTCEWVLIEVASVDPDSTAILKDSGDSITITATPDPDDESFHNVEWQRIKDDGSPEDLSDTGDSVTLDDSSEGVYEFQARHGPDDSWVGSGEVYVVKAEITGVSGSVLEGTEGPDIELELTPDTVSSSSISWTWKVKGGGSVGWNPNVNFDSPSSLETGVGMAKWFADPDDSEDCSASCTYVINCDLSIEGASFSDVVPNGVEFEVYMPAKGGSVAPPGATSSPTIYSGNYVVKTKEESDKTGTYTAEYVSSVGNFSYHYKSMDVYVGSNSDFMNKVITHENVHVSQRSSIYKNSDLSSIVGMQAPEGYLSQLVDVELEDVYRKHNSTWNDRSDGGSLAPGTLEHEAYSESNKVEPFYLYHPNL